MLEKRYVGMLVAAIIAIIVVYARLFHPTWDYFPPDSLVNSLERSWIVIADVRDVAFFMYIVVALGMMTLFFALFQRRWALHAGTKGLLFGMSLGIIWAFGFLTGWAFLGTTLRAETLNVLIDFVGLSAGGYLVGMMVGQDLPQAPREIPKPRLAVVLVALGFVAAHSLGTAFLSDLLAETVDLLLRPGSSLQYGLLLGLGAWAGQMFVMLRHTLPLRNTMVRSAFFAFGVFGHSWILFNLFFVIEFSGVFATTLLTGLMGSVGIFFGIVAYEWTAGDMRSG
ncbi:MAG: hypothetical protein OER91_06810 [Gammaproteobacteria bacterium]|nr:hypothetical protein [Gammaproteobacteria bacterium]